MSREHEFEFWMEMSFAASALGDNDGVWAAYEELVRLEQY